MVWEIIKSMKSFRGVISLLIAYMIFHGWAAIFFLLGIATQNAWLIGIGTTIILFWFGPGTPLIPLIIVTALFIQRYILLDQSNKIQIKAKWIELNEQSKQPKNKG
jgi:type IV secretory pathway VirB3-like protein